MKPDMSREATWERLERLKALIAEYREHYKDRFDVLVIPEVESLPIPTMPRPLSVNFLEEIVHDYTEAIKEIIYLHSFFFHS